MGVSKEGWTERLQKADFYEATELAYHLVDAMREALESDGAPALDADEAASMLAEAFACIREKKAGYQDRKRTPEQEAFLQEMFELDRRYTEQESRRIAEILGPSTFGHPAFGWDNFP